ncbi:hypothetical protein AK830_g9240 [Neonectria ditissima]|uniref:Uncharacterized protein n=1 Tax=Neonectria ditissima TaxID=78410 RepID=A0A0P7BCR9_9HYPO|nr:hypothetical protein AK830_g9240 [Neonectria ditissima]
MRLLCARTLSIEDFLDYNVPSYAILSHTWAEEEVTFQDMQGPAAAQKQGYTKIKHTCELALRDGLEYAWIDTCCIDKTSSAELSEAINSMMTWYHGAQICYTYLADVPPGIDVSLPKSPFKTSRWFTRGWTLQELLAPRRLAFLAQDWSVISSRDDLVDLVAQITNIDKSFLSTSPSANPNALGHSISRAGAPGLRSRLNSASIAERMSWASRRETTRVEDTAYCLLGIFGISLPLLYGEGQIAFFRLQEEIMRHSDDQSLLSWNFAHDDQGEAGVLASSPAAFSECKDIIPCDVGTPTPPFSVTNKGLRIEAPVSHHSDDSKLLLLQCRTKRDPTTMLAIIIRRRRDNLYLRSKASPELVRYQLWSEWQSASIYLLPNLAFTDSVEETPSCTVLLRNLPDGFRILEVDPQPLHREPGLRVVMDANLLGDDKPNAMVVLSSMDDTKPLLVHISASTVKSYLSGHGRREFDFSISCRFVRPPGQSFSLMALRKKYVDATDGHLYLSTPQGIFTSRIVRKSYFGQSLFYIDITQSEGLRPGLILDIARTDWSGHPALPGLHLQWLRCMRYWSTRIRNIIFAVLRVAVISPWMFTFLVEYAIERGFTCLVAGIKHMWKFQGAYTVVSPLIYLFSRLHQPQRIIRILAKVLKFVMAPRMLRMLRENTLDLTIVYVCCKLLPSELLSSIISITEV